MATLREILQTPVFTSFSFMMSNTGLFGLNMLKLLESTDQETTSTIDRVFGTIGTRVASGDLRPMVGREFRAEEAGAAHSFLLSRANTGKVVLNF